MSIIELKPKDEILIISLVICVTFLVTFVDKSLGQYLEYAATKIELIKTMPKFDTRVVTEYMPNCFRPNKYSTKNLSCQFKK